MIASRDRSNSTFAVLSAMVDIIPTPRKPQDGSRTYAGFTQHQDPQNDLQTYRLPTTPPAIRTTPSVAISCNPHTLNHVNMLMPQSANQHATMMSEDFYESTFNSGSFDPALATEFWMDADPLFFVLPFNNSETAQFDTGFDPYTKSEFEMWSTTPSGDE